MKDDLGTLALPALIVLGLIFWAFDAGLGDWQPIQPAVVVARSHEAERTTVSTGTMTDSSGQMQVVTTSSSEPEKWIVIVRVAGRVVSAKASPSTWADCTDGRAVSVRWRKGWITGANYGWRVW